MKTVKIILLLISVIVFDSCEGFLDVKPNKRTVVPQTLKDLQALLDNTSVMNQSATPSLGEISAGDFWVSLEDWRSCPVEERNTYTWQRDIFEITNNAPADWFSPYQQITYSNVALEQVSAISPTINEVESWNNVKGSALFFRAWAHFHLAQLFCKQYSTNTADVDIGIPLRLTADINTKIFRSTVQKTYQQIIDDLDEAVDLLPMYPLIKTRPSKVAAMALLARVYLQMEDYPNALRYASLTLEETTAQLMDFTSVRHDADYPFEQFNQEVIFHNRLLNRSILSQSVLRVDSILYTSYDAADLRKVLYFDKMENGVAFRGSYDGSSRLFSGISINEIYFIKIEAAARIGSDEESKKYLGDLLTKRYRGNEMPDYVGFEKDVYLQTILRERRKELLLRGLRWSDLRRLNRHNLFSKDLIRGVGVDTVLLPANSKRYVFPIPEIVVTLNGVEQNAR